MSKVWMRLQDSLFGAMQTLDRINTNARTCLQERAVRQGKLVVHEAALEHWKEGQWFRKNPKLCPYPEYWRVWRSNSRLYVKRSLSRKR